MPCLDLPGAIERCLDAGRLTVADLYREAERLAELLREGQLSVTRSV